MGAGGGADYLPHPRRTSEVPRLSYIREGCLPEHHASCPFSLLSFLNLNGEIYQHVNHFYVHRSVAIRTFTPLCDHHHPPTPELHLLKPKLCTH